jgi:putative membrane protein (TIGR04086 family)
MTTESISDLRPTWIAFGWFIAAAVAALLILAFIAVGVMSPDSTRGEEMWIGLALLIGFVVGGFFVGVRTGAAPLLHGVAIGLFSLVVWLLANLIPGEATGWTTWRALPTFQAVALIALQTVAAVVGTRMGLRWLARD